MSTADDASLDSDDWFAREQATRRLGSGPDTRSVTRLLLRALGDPEGEVRKAAVEALGRRRTTRRRLQALVHALVDEEWEVRWAAARSLGQTAPRSQAAQRALEQATHDADPAVAGAATSALDRSEATLPRGER